MSKADSEPRKDLTPEELFAQVSPLLDSVVRMACLHCCHDPTLEDVKRLTQRLHALLLDNDFQLLRDYRHEAGLRTYLQAVANHRVSHFLQDERRKVNLDELPEDFFTASQTQEDEIWEKEKLELLKKAVKRLTKRERQLFALLLAG